MEMKAILPGVWKLSFGKPEEHVPTRYQELPPNDMGLSALPEVSLPKGMEAESWSFKKTKRGCVIKLSTKTNPGHWFGCGLQLLSHEQTALKRTMRVNSDPTQNTGDSHAPVPFMVSSKGFGILVDSFRYVGLYPGCHDLNSEQSDTSAEEKTIADNTEDLYAGKMDESRPFIIEVPVAEGADIWRMS